MSDEIKQVLELFIGQEEKLLAQHAQIHGQRGDVQKEVSRDLITFGARELFGRTVGKYARKAIELGEKERIKGQEDTIDSQHRGIVNQIKGLLSTVSEWKKTLKEPNSDQLIARLERAQTGARVDTRIRHTVKALTTLKSKRLIHNKDLPIISPTDVILPPGSPFTGLMELRKVLGSATGYVKICDTYVNVKTLDILNSIPTSIPIKLLTMNTGGSKRAPAFLRACKDFKSERPSFEVRKGEGLHDRFILMPNQGWSVGSSLNAFGNKVSVLTPLQEKGKRELEKIFDDLWKKARVLIP